MCETCPGISTASTHISTQVIGKLGKVDPPVLFAFFNVRLVNELENAITFPEVAFMILTVMFMRNLGVES